MPLSRTRTHRPGAAVLSLLLPGIALAGCGLGGAESSTARPASATVADQVTTYPSSMDALGGSVLLGFNTDCPDPFTDCPENSWATGTSSVVDSVYLHLLALDPSIRGHNANDAESGTTMADLDGQAQNAVRRRAELVIIAMGTNDACGGRTGSMTEPDVFRRQFAHAMDTLTTRMPTARIHVVSIPDLYQRWVVLHTDPVAMKAWRSVPFCPTLFTRPTSKAPADEARRVAVRTRVSEYNASLSSVCSQHPTCTTDEGAAFRAPVVVGDFSTHDYWHPNLAGQAALAALVWSTLRYPTTGEGSR